jgi:hypothetical protein
VKTDVVHQLSRSGSLMVCDTPADVAAAATRPLRKGSNCNAVVVGLHTAHVHDQRISLLLALSLLQLHLDAAHAEANQNLKQQPCSAASAVSVAF